MIAHVIGVARTKNRKIGIYRAGAERLAGVRPILVEQKIDSISLNPDTALKTTMSILATEQAQRSWVAA